MKEQTKAPEEIQIGNEETANLSDAEFKTLVIRMLAEMVEYGYKIEGKMKTMKSDIKENVQGNQQLWEGNWDSNQQCGAEGRKKHSTRTE